MYNLWSWNRLYLGEEASRFFGVDSLQLRAGEVFVFSPFFVCLGLLCILPSFMVIYAVFIDQKIKNLRLALFCKGPRIHVKIVGLGLNEFSSVHQK